MEILNTYQQLTEGAEDAMFAMVILSFIIFFIGIIAIAEKYIKTGIVILIFIVTCVLLLIFNYSNLPRDTFHEVVINDLGKFDYEKYKIVSQKGKILTIKEVN